MSYFTYILRCVDDTLYTGITTDLMRRVDEHNADDKKWAKYTKYRRPVELVYSEKYENRSDASKREYTIKEMTREEKIKLIQS
jgi:putative endonuclease